MIRNGNFPHVVHDGRQADLFNIAPGKAVSQTCILQKSHGNFMDPPDVGAGFVAFKFNDIGQRFCHANAEPVHLLRFFKKLVLLALHLAAQPSFGLEQPDNGIDSVPDDIGNDWFGNQIHNA